MGAYEFGDCGARPPLFRRADSNADGSVDISDAVTNLLYLFAGREEPSCLDGADANDDGEVDITDPIFLLGGLFTGGEAVPPPAGHCGADPTADELTCEAYPPCE
jgi:hypothetical protein